MDELAPDGLAFEVTSPEPSTAVVTIRGELDIGNVERLAAVMAPVIGTGPDRLILDVGALRFADSSAIALWVRWAKVVPAIELRGTSALLRRVITAMGLERTLRLSP